MTYSVPLAPGEQQTPVMEGGPADRWPMWEVFVRQRRGLSHVHAGSLHAPDATTALQAARDVYTRRVEGASLWVVRSAAITASDPAEADAFFEVVQKPYVQATYFHIPEEVGQM